MERKGTLWKSYGERINFNIKLKECVQTSHRRPLTFWIFSPSIWRMRMARGWSQNSHFSWEFTRKKRSLPSRDREGASWV